MRLLFVLAAALLLSGCWLGDSFYTASDARPAIPPGRYAVTGIPSDGDEERAPNREPLDISIRPSGLTRIADDQDQELRQVGLTPLSGTTGDYVIWLVARYGERTSYGLLRRLGEGDYLVVFPDCRATLDVARAAHARISEPDPGSDPRSRSCEFPDRASLEAALRQLHPDPDHLEDGMLRLRRLPNG